MKKIALSLIGTSIIMLLVSTAVYFNNTTLQDDPRTGGHAYLFLPFPVLSTSSCAYVMGEHICSKYYVVWGIAMSAVVWALFFPVFILSIKKTFCYQEIGIHTDFYI